MVNSYLNVLLGNGFFGLSLLLGFILLGAFKAWALSRRIADVDADFSMMGASLVACILGTLLMMVDGSFVSGLERMFYVLAGFAAGYSNLGPSLQRDAQTSSRRALAVGGFASDHRDPLRDLPHSNMVNR